MKLDADLTAIEGGVPVYVKVSDNYYNKVYRTYWNDWNSQFGSEDAGITMVGTAATFTISPALTTGTTYRYQVKTVNMDGVVSSAGELVVAAP